VGFQSKEERKRNLEDSDDAVQVTLTCTVVGKERAGALPRVTLRSFELKDFAPHEHFDNLKNDSEL
jgi:hypothetical protein